MSLDAGKVYDYTPGAERQRGRFPPALYFIGSALFHYLGPSFAVLLFARVPVAGVAWLRIVSAGVVFLLWRRPWRAFFRASPRTRRLIVALGAILATMNYAFYFAIDGLPLGTVAAIEFVGPILLALFAVRSWHNLAALFFAACGVYLLADVRYAGAPTAFAWALLNAALFTAYIVIAHRLSRCDPDTSPVDRLAAAMLVAAIVITPFGLGSALPAMQDPVTLAAGLGVGLSSSVIPYALDQLAMRRLAQGTYALFVALLPATAVLMGIVVLQQIPTWLEIVAVGLVIAGVLVHREPATEEPQ